MARSAPYACHVLPVPTGPASSRADKTLHS
jgi:hypothetical protein